MADGRVTFGHRRLAVVDLSDAARQPMQDALGRVSIVFNGEIYNFEDLRSELRAKGHQFRSNSDTEVIVAAYLEWGSDCVTRLNGMFAFAIWDRGRQQVLLARDRAGEKPLFFRVAAGVLSFASELKGLLSDPSFERTLDRDALDCYLALGYVPGERCILHGVRKLPPGTALLFDINGGNISLWRYWALPDPDEISRAPGGEGALSAELEALLADAVRRQLVADVPVGVLLSGGMDSSLITAMAARATAKVKTFTVRFPGHGRLDETEHARLIARHFGTEHIELDAAVADPSILIALARQYDEPIADSSIIPTEALCQLVRQHCTVALGGDGGDELFGGYTHYSDLLSWRRGITLIPQGLRRVAADAAESHFPVGLKGRNWIQRLDVNPGTGLPSRSPRFDRTTRQRLLPDQSADQFVGERIRDDRTSRAPDLLQRATRTDFENYLPEDVLVKVDRASMLNSLEVRAPFLDHRVIEFAFGKVPSRLKVTTGGRKALLKPLADRLLPPAFNQGRKQGFSIPLGSWLRSGPWLDMFREVLLSSESIMFDRAVVAQLLYGQSTGRANSERLFALVLFELWRREYKVSA